MGSMEFTVALTMFSPAIAIFVLIIALVIVDIRDKKQSAYEDELIRKCIKAKSYECVERIIRIAKECNLGKKFIIKSLEKELETLKEETTR
jgi:hypothetical protein